MSLFEIRIARLSLCPAENENWREPPKIKTVHIHYLKTHFVQKNLNFIKFH